MTEYINNLETEVFALATKQYEQIINQLTAEKLQSEDHANVEAFLKTQGDELLRRLLQGYLDIRARNEAKLDCVTGDDGVQRTHKRGNCLRTLSSLFGSVSVRRIGYSLPGLGSIYPLDAELNLAPDKYTHGIRAISAKTAAKESFSGVVNNVVDFTAGKLPKRQAEQLAQRTGLDFDAFYRQKVLETDKDDELMVLTTDAKGIVVRQQDLRDATRKAAENQQHKKQTRLSPGEKKNRKRMAQVASVYCIKAHERTALDIMGNDPVAAEEPVKKPKPTNKRVWASIEKDSGRVISEMFDEALRRDPEKIKQWIGLVDGNADQINKMEAFAVSAGVEIVILMDFIHVLEYLWKAAYALFGSNDPKAESWVKGSAIKLLDSKASRVSADVRSRATKQGLSDLERQAIEKCANYILKNKCRLDYKTALENGWPIATGVIEGACRYLIKDRMDITGARWSLPGAESILKLRALHCSNDMDAYMDFHRQQEHSRNYGYMDQKIKFVA